MQVFAGHQRSKDALPLLSTFLTFCRDMIGVVMQSRLALNFQTPSLSVPSAPHSQPLLHFHYFPRKSFTFRHFVLFQKKKIQKKGQVFVCFFFICFVSILAGPVCEVCQMESAENSFIFKSLGPEKTGTQNHNTTPNS